MVFIEIIENSGIIGLFLANFLSSSILPFPHEPAIIFSLQSIETNTVFITSMIGAMLGAILNYYIGLKGLRNIITKRSKKREIEAEGWFKKYGPAVLLISPWIPFLGDPLTIVAGTLNMDLKKFLIYTLIGKLIKIGVIVYLGINLLALFGV